MWGWMVLTCDSNIKLTISPRSAGLPPPVLLVSLANTTKYSWCLYKLWTTLPRRGGTATELITSKVTRNLRNSFTDMFTFEVFSISRPNFLWILKSRMINRKIITPTKDFSFLSLICKHKSKFTLWYQEDEIWKKCIIIQNVVHVSHFGVIHKHVNYEDCH